MSVNARKSSKQRLTHSLLEPLHGVLLLDAVREANSALASFSPCYARAWSAHDDVEVCAENANCWVVLEWRHRVSRLPRQ